MYSEEELGRYQDPANDIKPVLWLQPRLSPSETPQVLFLKRF